MTDFALKNQCESVHLLRIESDYRDDAQKNAIAPTRMTFRDLYQAEFPYVWQTLRRLGVRPADLEDIAHDLFVTVHGKFGDYDPTRPIRPWLFGFAFRIAADYRRSARYQREVASDRTEVADFADSRPSSDEQLDAVDNHRLIAEALESLDMDQRAIFVMHELDEVSIPDAAAVLGAPLNTLYSRLRLARKQFAIAVNRLQARRRAQ